MDIYCKNCKKYTECTHSKILVLIWSKKAKVKLRCSECLTDRMLFDKINGEYELEQLVKHFFLYWCILQKNMQTYCVKCRKKPENLNSKIFKTNNGRLIMQSKCSECGIKKLRCERTRSKMTIK